ncbi:MAG: hypothetical protein IPK60_10385 [Sandaracinaceae bacterium]|nr:hypothetical protein [Sandaracinaceae bacterium]
MQPHAEGYFLTPESERTTFADAATFIHSLPGIAPSAVEALVALLISQVPPVDYTAGGGNRDETLLWNALKTKARELLRLHNLPDTPFDAGERETMPLSLERDAMVLWKLLLRADVRTVRVNGWWVVDPSSRPREQLTSECIVGMKVREAPASTILLHGAAILNEAGMGTRQNNSISAILAALMRAFALGKRGVDTDAQTVRRALTDARKAHKTKSGEPLLEADLLREYSEYAQRLKRLQAFIARPMTANIR